MSAGIRQQLGPAMTRLTQLIQQSNNHLAADQATANLVQFATTAEQLRRHIDSVHRLLVDWGKLIPTLAQALQAAEEERLEGWTNGAGVAPAELTIEGQDALTNLEIQIDIIRSNRNGGNANGGGGPGGGAPRPPNISIRLPQLELPEFDGTPSRWYTFWEAFTTAIDGNEGLNAAQKLNYLYSCLKGNARSLIEGLAFTNDNYPIATNLLKGRYADDARRKQELQTELLQLPRAINTGPSLRSLFESIERICRQLQTLGVDLNTNPFLTTAIKDKLPPETRQFLADKMVAAGVDWTPEQWRKGLETAVRVKEAAQVNHDQGNHPRVAHSHPQQPQYKRGNGNGGRIPHTERAFAGIQNPKPASRQAAPNFTNKGQCSLCGETNHKPSACPKYPTPQARRQRLIDQNRCLRCAWEWKGNHEKHCTNQSVVCRNCKGKHHSLICRNPWQKPDGRASSGANTQPMGNRNVKFASNSNGSGQFSNQNLIVSPCLETRPPAYLMMGKALIRSPGISPGIEDPYQVAHIFWDTGSQPSLITDRMINLVKPQKLGNEPLSITGCGSIGPNKFPSARYAILLKRLDGGLEEIVVNRTAVITPSFGFLETPPELFPQGMLAPNEGHK